MIRAWFAYTLGLILLAGCSDARRPAVRHGAAESDSPSTAPAEARDLFHAAPRGMGRPQALGPEVSLGAVYLTAPEGWIRKQPRSDFVLAEFNLSRAQGDGADGRLTVTAVGGSIEANVDRWRQQFGGKPEEESREHLEIAGLKVALVDFSGTYLDQPMGIGPAEPRPAYRMLAAIFGVGGRQYILKCYGPQRTIADHADEFLAFIGSVKSAGPSSGAPESAKPIVTDAKPAEAETGKSESAEAQAAE